MLLNKYTYTVHGITRTQTLSILPHSLLSLSPSHKHTPHLYVGLEVEQVNLLPVAAI